MSISTKQRQIMAFPFTQYDALICDGAIRSGKTAFMMLAFVDDAMRRYNHQRFGVCGKTVDSTIKNIIMPYLDTVYAHERYTITWHRADKLLVVTGNGAQNVFEVFGGKDESSFQLIQGRTLAGVLLDEVTLQPRSFVEQALARCSVEGSKFWFNCNPGSPSHWFYTEWLLKAKDKNALHLHFNLRDNPSLSEKIIKRYEAMYSGVFYARYINGEWVAAEGAIYPSFSDCLLDASTIQPPFEKVMCSMDYGTQNATAMLLWGLKRGVWYCLKEYYYSGRATQHPLTDDEYLQALINLTDGTGCSQLIIDPSAASFIALVRRKNIMSVRAANNDVLDGIRETANAMQRGLVKVSRACANLIREMGSYVWDEKSAEDKPKKQDDHAPDAMRYFVKTMCLVRGRRGSLIS